MTKNRPATAPVSRRIGLGGRIVTILLLVSLLPLLTMACGAWVVFGRLVADRSIQIQRGVVEAHAAAIESYLAESLLALDLVARTHGPDELSTREGLGDLLDSLNESHDNAFVDLGVIDSSGHHLAYVGPYDLEDRNYARSEWFRTVMLQRSYVSDVFLGFRGVPHCVMAVRNQEGLRPWILRATIDSEKFDALVRTGKLGSSGDSFIVNASGVYQTTPMHGAVLTPSFLPSPLAHRGLQESKVAQDGTSVIRITTWLNDGRWMLVVQQDETEIMSPLYGAMGWGGLILLLSVVLIVVTTITATRHLTGRIARVDEEKIRMSSDLIRSAKLASLGELSTGLAHEINNPLAIISTELTNMSDVISMEPSGDPAEGEILESIARCDRQVTRCATITSKMLQFGRESGSTREPTDVVPKLVEIVDLMRKQAQVNNVDLVLTSEPNLPQVHIDPTELQQVVINLINNAIYAISGQGTVEVTASTARRDLVVTVHDTGSGIAPEDLDKIFLPFFSTKPVGKGTGLGLSVCYGIVQGWGGTIEAESSPGIGTTMKIRMPSEKSRNDHHRDSKGHGGDG